MAVDRLIIIITFSFFTLLRRNLVYAQSNTDGELFIRDILDNKISPEKPGYLYFTAPYKICEGGCKKSLRDSNDNLRMAFPLYVGRRSNNQGFRTLYGKDFDAYIRSRATRLQQAAFTTCKQTLANTQSTMYPIMNPDRTSSTIPPGQDRQTSSTALPSIGSRESTMSTHPNRKKYQDLRYTPANDFLDYESLRKRRNYPGGNLPRVNEIPKKNVGMHRANTLLIRRTVSMSSSKPLLLLERRLLPQNHLGKKRKIQLPQFGIMPVLPIRQEPQTYKQELQT